MIVLRKVFTVLLLIASVFLVNAVELKAANRASDPARIHSVTLGDLHQAVQSSAREAGEARESVRQFLQQADTTAQIGLLGLNAGSVEAKLAGLTDAEVVRLNQQLMALDAQQETAGLSKGAKIGIIAGIAGGTALIIWYLLVLDDLTDYGY